MKEIRMRLIVEDKEINTIIRDGETLCGAIVPALDYEQIMTLLEMGVKADQISKCLLHEQKTADMLYLLIKHGMSIYWCNSWDVKKSEIDIQNVVELLCEKGRRSIDKVVGELWYHWKDKLCDELDFLLEKGADLDKIVRHIDKDTAKSMFDWFLKHGADINSVLEAIGCDHSFYNDGWGEKELVEKLLDMGASVKNIVKSGCFWRTQDANQRAEILELLFERGASLADILCSHAEEPIESEEDVFRNFWARERFIMITHPDILSRHGLDYRKFEFKLKKRSDKNASKKIWYLNEYVNLGTTKIHYISTLFGTEVIVNLTNLEKSGLKINRRKFFEYVVQRRGEEYLHKYLDSEDYSY